MAGKGSKKYIGSVLMQAMLAAKTVRAQRDRLQQLQHRLQDLQADAGAPTATPADAAADATLGELASNLFEVYYIGLEARARMLTACIEIAAKKGVRFSPPNLAFAVMPDEQLHDALLAQQFPAHPRSQAHTLDHAMAAVLAIKLLEEHLLPRCVECLAGGKAPVPGKTPDSSTSSPDSSPDRDDLDPDPVAAATEALAKVDLSDDPDATATATAKSGSSKPRQAARGGGGDVGKSLDYLYRACRIATLAVKHIDVAVSVLSRFMEPKKLASLAEFCDDHAYISEEGFYLASVDYFTSSIKPCSPYQSFNLPSRPDLWFQFSFVRFICCHALLFVFSLVRLVVPGRPWLSYLSQLHQLGAINVVVV